MKPAKPESLQEYKTRIIEDKKKYLTEAMKFRQSLLKRKRIHKPPEKGSAG